MCRFAQQWPVIVQAGSALIQAATAVLIVLLTRRLVRATDSYAQITQQSFALSNRQFEQELLPHWHISFSPAGVTGVALLRILNMSKSSARITHLFIRVIEPENEPEPRRFPLDLGMPSGHQEVTGNVARSILEVVNGYLVNGDWNGVLEMGVVFSLAGSPEPRPSNRFFFRVAVRDGVFTEATARLPYIAADLGEGNGRE